MIFCRYCVSAGRQSCKVARTLEVDAIDAIGKARTASGAGGNAACRGCSTGCGCTAVGSNRNSNASTISDGVGEYKLSGACTAVTVPRCNGIGTGRQIVEISIRLKAAIVEAVSESATTAGSSCDAAIAGASRTGVSAVAGNYNCNARTGI